jgi:GntR family transcriptional regulator
MDQTLEPVLLTEDQAQFLETQPGTPAMLSKVCAYNNEGVPIEYSWSVTRGDQCRFYFSFRRGEECS